MSDCKDNHYLGFRGCAFARRMLSISCLSRVERVLLFDSIVAVGYHPKTLDLSHCHYDITHHNVASCWAPERLCSIDQSNLLTVSPTLLVTITSPMRYRRTHATPDSSKKLRSGQFQGVGVKISHLNCLERWSPLPIASAGKLRTDNSISPGSAEHSTCDLECIVTTYNPIQRSGRGVPEE